MDGTRRCQRAADLRRLLWNRSHGILYCASVLGNSLASENRNVSGTYFFLPHTWPAPPARKNCEELVLRNLIHLTLSRKSTVWHRSRTKVLLKMCGTAVKLSNSKEVPEKYCQVVAENFVQNPTVKMSYETINTEGRLQSRKNKSSGGNGHSAVKTET